MQLTATHRSRLENQLQQLQASLKYAEGRQYFKDKATIIKLKELLKERG